MSEHDDPARQALVLEQRRRLFNSIIHGNDNLDKRMYSILQSGSIIVGFVSVFKFSSLSATNILNAIMSREWGLVISQVPLLMVLVLYLAIAMASIWYLRPLDKKVSGTTDWGKTFSDYLYSEECFNQILADLHESINDHETLNEYKAKGASHLSWLLVGQLIFLILTVGFT